MVGRSVTTPAVPFGGRWHGRSAHWFRGLLGAVRVNQGAVVSPRTEGRPLRQLMVAVPERGGGGGGPSVGGSEPATTDRTTTAAAATGGGGQPRH